MRPRQLRLFEKPDPGDCVQIDVKHVRIPGRRDYQYTALDDCTRVRVLRLHRQLSLRSSLELLGELRRRLPFPIRRIQTDHGPEFPLDFVLAVKAGWDSPPIYLAATPQQNGKVERSQRIDHEGFWSRHQFDTVDDASQALQRWERPPTAAPSSPCRCALLRSCVKGNLA